MKAGQKSGWMSGSKKMLATLILVVSGWSFAESASAQSLATVASVPSKSWMQRTFGREDWSTVAKAYETPREICRMIERSVRYTEEKADQWSTSQDTWNRGRGDCEDFAICIQELCRQSGLPARVHLYFPAGGREGHAVLVGEWNGKIWFSSNGSYEEVKSEDEVRARVARMLSCKAKNLWVMRLTQTDVEKYLAKNSARPLEVAAR